MSSKLDSFLVLPLATLTPLAKSRDYIGFSLSLPGYMYHLQVQQHMIVQNFSTLSQNCDKN